MPYLLNATTPAAATHCATPALAQQAKISDHARMLDSASLPLSAALPTPRATLLAQLQQPVRYDVAIVGGGATGLGIALDAAARGLRVVLLESHDFAKGTSSRATKLLHGGVRYLAQGHIHLVHQALHERTTVLRNAAHIAQPLAFVMPAYRWWEKPFYGCGLALYDLLAGADGLGRTRILSRAQTLQCLPHANAAHLRGGVQYWDAQFDDARLAIALARTAAQHGALLLNYCRATDLRFHHGKVSGLVCQDTLTGTEYGIEAACVINATGVWVDALRHVDGHANPHDGRHPTRAMVAPSQGVHIVVDRSFLDSDNALMVPHTRDGRVLFAVPWLGKVILGTTDTPRHDLPREPQAFADEVQFILSESARYLRRAPTRDDIKSIWVGLRPLVKAKGDDGHDTKTISREHTILVSRSHLVSVTGGKWTTYRAIASDVLETCNARGLLPTTSPCTTQHLPLIGAHAQAAIPLTRAPGIHSYGSEKDLLQSLPGADHWLCEGLSEAMVRFAARFEYAMTVEDVLARRSRLLFLDARQALALAPRIAEILQHETGRPGELDAFRIVARNYLHIPS